MNPVPPVTSTAGPRAGPASTSGNTPRASRCSRITATQFRTLHATSPAANTRNTHDTNPCPASTSPVGAAAHSIIVGAIATRKPP